MTAAQMRQAMQRAARVRWNAVRAQLGLPVLAVPEVAYSQRPRAVAMRRRRALARRMAAYDGVKYDDRMASSPRVRVAYLELYGDETPPETD